MTNGMRRAPHVSRDAGLLFNIPQSPPTVKGAIHRPVLLQNPGSFFKQDVCLRPPSPQINNPQNLISGGRVEALESHYFHIPYPEAMGLLRECGRPGTVKARGCGGNLRPSARLQGGDKPRQHHSRVQSKREIMHCWHADAVVTPSDPLPVWVKSELLLLLQSARQRRRVLCPLTSHTELKKKIFLEMQCWFGCPVNEINFIMSVSISGYEERAR